MEPSLLGAAVLEGGPDRKIKLDRSPGIDEVLLYIHLPISICTLTADGKIRLEHKLGVDSELFFELDSELLYISLFNIVYLYIHTRASNQIEEKDA